MSVYIKLQRPDGTLIANFPGEDNIGIAQMAKNNGIEFPTSCGIGVCGVCKCTIISGKEHIQIDKISPPTRELARDDEGNFEEVFACIWGIKKESLQDTNTYEIILEKNM